MADKKISALDAVTTPTMASEFAVNEGGTSKKMTLAQVLGSDTHTFTVTTTDGVQTEMLVAAARISVATDSTYMFRVDLVARRTDADNESGGYVIEGAIDNNAGTTAMVGPVFVTSLAEDNSAWDVTVVADDTNDAVVPKVTGEAGKTISWVGRMQLVKVTG